MAKIAIAFIRISVILGCSLLFVISFGSIDFDVWIHFDWLIASLTCISVNSMVNFSSLFSFCLHASQIIWYWSDRHVAIDIYKHEVKLMIFTQFFIVVLPHRNSCSYYPAFSRQIQKTKLSTLSRWYFYRMFPPNGRNCARF